MTVEERHRQQQERQALLIWLGILVQCHDCKRAIPEEHAHPIAYGGETYKVCFKCCPRCGSNQQKDEK